MRPVPATGSKRNLSRLLGKSRGRDRRRHAVVGFTIAIFISALAFEEQELQDQAKLAILAGSAAAAVIGLAVLYARHRVLRARASG